MDQKERMLAELPYIASDEVLSRERLECKRRIYELNQVHPDQYNRIPGLLKELFGKSGEAVFVEPPFHCDYGYNIEVGDNVWIGGSVVIIAGVSIGNNVVIGGGSVVTRDIPDGVVAAGNPCRVIREITEEDRKYYFKKRVFDVEI
ncbi:maltose acetyltransferase domain-containing protein [Bariatricus sp. HCP3S3_E12]|uniref:maltose acetyltransferase domain-containing protein n=1 Tax=Bariatricus sp. HCP3S3_E12 TaxID=3438906 RepID=UPI003F88B015